MLITADKFKSKAIAYVDGLHGLSTINRERIADSLLQSISAYDIEELSTQDFELIVNQFFNLICFGPITNLELFITEDCNLSCDYCFVRKKHQNKMPLDDIFSAINFLVFYSGKTKHLNVTLFGGEPLMEKETIYQVVDFCQSLEADLKTKKISISITTNGTLLDEEFLKRTHKNINFLLSIDGDKETHDTYRKYKNGRGTFDTVVSKIQLLKYYQPWLGARMTILPETISSLYENVASLHKLGINQFLFGPAMDVEWDKDALINYGEQLRKVSLYYLEKKKAGRPFRVTLLEKKDHRIDCHEQQWGCGAGRNTISVNTKGDIYPCSKFVGYEEFENPELKLGNLHEGITNIKLRTKMSKITDHAFPACNSCKEVNACMGGCPADNYYLNRNLYKAGDAHCELKKIENCILREMYQDE